MVEKEPLSSQDLQAVFNVLKEALSQDIHVRSGAELSLQELELRHGFCSCLLVSRRRPPEELTIKTENVPCLAGDFWRRTSRTPCSMACLSSLEEYRDQILALPFVENYYRRRKKSSEGSATFAC